MLQVSSVRGHCYVIILAEFNLQSFQRVRFTNIQQPAEITVSCLAIYSAWYCFYFQHHQYKRVISNSLSTTKETNENLIHNQNWCSSCNETLRGRKLQMLRGFIETENPVLGGFAVIETIARGGESNRSVSFQLKGSSLNGFVSMSLFCVNCPIQ